MDSRIKIDESGVIQTLSSRMGTGGGNVPLLLKVRSGCDGGGKGPLIQEDVSATLSCNNDQTLFVPKTYGICSKDSNAMKSDNPHSGFYEADSSRTLDANGGKPSCNQGGVAVVESYAIQGSMIGRSEKNGPQGDGINEDVSFTLNTVDRHAVYAVATDKTSRAMEECAPTLAACDFKDHTIVKTGSYLTIEKKEGASVPVAVWEVTPEDERALDRYEGCPTFYYKTEMVLPITGIRTGKVRRRRTFVYIMHEERELGRPNRGYMMTCVEGYRAFGFDPLVLMQALEAGGEVRA